MEIGAENNQTKTKTIRYDICSLCSKQKVYGEDIVYIILYDETCGVCKQCLNDGKHMQYIHKQPNKSRK
jgi:hypothetical protein